MRTLLKKYAIVAIPLFLCALIISYKPALITAATTCYDNNNQVVDCGSADAVSADNGQGAAQISGGSTANPSSGTVTGNPANNNPTPSYTLLEPLPCIPSAPTKDSTGKVISPGIDCSKYNGAGNPVSSIDFQNYVQFFFNLVIALSAAAAVFMIAAGGLRLMTTDSWTGATVAKKQIQNAVIGLIIVLGSYFLLQIVDPRLVQIPTTLVPPLNINYKGQTNAFMGTIQQQVATMDQISQQTNTLMDQANKLRNDANAAYAKINTDQAKADDLQSQIANELLPNDPEDQAALSPEAVSSYCSSSASFQNDAVRDLCSQFTQTNQEISQTQANMTAETAQGTMYAQVEQCMGIGSHNGGAVSTGPQTMQACLDNIYQTGVNASVSLNASNNPDLAKQITDQSNYAQTLAKINNSVVSNMTYSPQAAALLQDAEASVLVLSSGVGAAVGSLANPVKGTAIGAGAGFVVGDLINNTTLTATQKKAQSADAQLTITQIGAAVDNSNITDSTLKAQLVSEAQAIAKSLGGTLKLYK